MKHLGNCTPKEFLAQVVRLRGAYMRWVGGDAAAGREALRLAAFSGAGDLEAARREMAADPALRDFFYVMRRATDEDFFRGVASVREEQLETLGVPWVTEAVAAAVCQRKREEAFRRYVGDRLYTLCAALGSAPAGRYGETLPREARGGMKVAVERLEGMGVKVSG